MKIDLLRSTSTRLAGYHKRATQLPPGYTGNKHHRCHGCYNRMEAQQQPQMDGKLVGEIECDPHKGAYNYPLSGSNIAA